MTKSGVTILLLMAFANYDCRSQIRQGLIPEGVSFHGVWQSPQYGRMDLCQKGNQIVGGYSENDRFGYIDGEIKGDLLLFQWEDTRELVPDKPTKQYGRGYFRIEIGEDGEQYLRGEWGLKKAKLGGGPWNAVKLRSSVQTKCGIE